MQIGVLDNHEIRPPELISGSNRNRFSKWILKQVQEDDRFGSFDSAHDDNRSYWMTDLPLKLN